ncbi:MAG: hypothetical protein QNJ41_28440 [Xenococcaceae cyanobacterium MO_188.B32]|nr:hypothetical protein [Xenococcaceae cyanobacterium MO_188.B32]
MMPNVHSVTWRDIPRNKFLRTLHPAMFSDSKYHKYMEFTPTGCSEKKLFLVEYDEEYALKWIANKLCKPLEVLGEKQIIQLVKEAYEQSQQIQCQGDLLA